MDTEKNHESLLSLLGKKESPVMNLR